MAMTVDQEFFRTLQVCPKDFGRSLSDGYLIAQEEPSMLYRPNIRPENWFQTLTGAVAGALAYLLKSRSDAMYLDGMRQSELEDLRLRRADDGSYRPFGD